jgi:PAT family beta-lactamase induction signal transducer AmpG
VTLRRKLGFVALVYVIEGAPAGIFHNLWPVYLRRHGVGQEEIGWLAALAMAWSLKVLWSPLVDRWSEPRRWIAGCMLAMAACLLASRSLDGAVIPVALWIAFAAFCLASATQDVAIDAYTIMLVDRGEEGPANSVRTAAYRAGVLGAGGALLIVAGWIGWATTFAAAALVWVALAAAVFACPALPVSEAARRDLRGALLRWVRRPSAAGAALFVLLYRLGDRAMGPMVQPFWVDRGFSDAEIGSVSVLIGAFATVAGAVAGGALVARIGIPRALLALGLLALASNLGYAAAAAWPGAGRSGVYAASVVESLCSGLATAAFLSFLMRICEKEHAAVQYALAYAMSSVAGALVAIPSGSLAASLGYAAYFALTALFALPAFAFLPAAKRWIDADGGERSARRG